MKIKFAKALFALSMVGLLSACNSSQVNSNWTDETTSDERVLVRPNSFTQEMGDFHTKNQESYIRSTFNTISSYGLDGKTEYSKPKGVEFDYTSQTDMKYVQVAMKSDFSDAVEYTLNSAHKYTVTNVYKGTKYYYRASATKGSYESSEIKEFTTCSQGPRNLDVGGVTNFRDLGGYTSKLGGKIKQGLYFRGATLFSGSSTEGGRGSLKLTTSGLKTFTETLGIKTEVDFRMDRWYNLGGSWSTENGNQRNGDVPGVSYNVFPIDWSSSNMLRDRTEQVTGAFKLYADNNNYPLYVHCSIGTDRTGMFSFLMGAFLGMSYEDLYTDYLFSNFAQIGGTRDDSVIRNVYEPYLRTFNKPTLAECAEAYLLENGVTKAQCDSVREIMLEK